MDGDGEGASNFFTVFFKRFGDTVKDFLHLLIILFMLLRQVCSL